jgi:acylphosphatase
MDNLRSHLIIQGRVQGVWFRESTRREANRLGVFGWVRNRIDGTVEIVAEGREDKIQELISWCHNGPPSANVTSVHAKEETWTGEFSTFDITF